jgi:hypothetical protein
VGLGVRRQPAAAAHDATRAAAAPGAVPAGAAGGAADGFDGADAHAGGVRGRGAGAQSRRQRGGVGESGAPRPRVRLGCRAPMPARTITQLLPSRSAEGHCCEGCGSPVSPVVRAAPPPSQPGDLSSSMSLEASPTATYKLAYGGQFPVLAQQPAAAQAQQPPYGDVVGVKSGYPADPLGFLA